MNLVSRSLILIPMLCSASVLSQQTSSGTEHHPITLDVVVAPMKGGAPIAELRKTDFEILDNKKPQQIQSFIPRGLRDLPTEVVIVIDDVNTYYTTIAYERGQITKFLRSNGGHLAHPTAIAVVSDTGVQMSEHFSSDGNAISDSLAHNKIGLRDIRRAAGFYGAEERLDLSLNALHLLTAKEAQKPGRKLILWISPQWPILSGPEVQLDRKETQSLFENVVSFSTELRKARVTLYSIDPIGVEESLTRADYYQAFLKGIAKPNQTQIGNLALQVLAVQSGGQAFNSSGVAHSLQSSFDDTTAYYEITFDPPPSTQPNEYHDLQVKVSDGGAATRTRQGYYLNPDWPAEEKSKPQLVLPSDSGPH